MARPTEGEGTVSERSFCFWNADHTMIHHGPGCDCVKPTLQDPPTMVTHSTMVSQIDAAVAAERKRVLEAINAKGEADVTTAPVYLGWDEAAGWASGYNEAMRQIRAAIESKEVGS